MEVVLDALRFERDRRVVVDVPALVFPDRSTTAIFGPNGAGKTTLLRLVAGLERPTAGRVLVGGVPTAPRDHRMAFAFQQAVFLRGDVRSNLALGLALRGVEPAEREARVAAAARECGIVQLLDRAARRLSAGEAQRTNLARALALRAPVTLLDEPLAGVDRIARGALLEDLPRMLAAFATTVLVVTHDREEAFRLADRLVVLAGGRVTAAGPKGEVYRCPPDRETALLLGYAVLPTPAGEVAVPPGALRIGAGTAGMPAFELAVRRAVDMGNHIHLVGTAGGVMAEVRLRAGEPSAEPGAVVRIHAAQHVPLGK